MTASADNETYSTVPHESGRGETVGNRVARHIPPDFAYDTRIGCYLTARVDAAFDAHMAGRDQEISDLMANRAKLKAESDKLLAAHFADAIDLLPFKRHQGPHPGWPR